MPVRHEIAAPALTELLFDDPGVGRCLVAPDGSVLRANAEWLRSTGFTLADVLGADVTDLFPETRDSAVALHARVRAGHRVEVPRRVQPVDGRDTWWEGSIDPVPMENGTGLLITAREVTAPARPRLLPVGYVRASAEALRSSTLLRAVADYIPDPVFVKDTASRILFANPATLKAIGKPAEQVIGKTDREFFDDPEIGAAILATDRQVMASGAAVSVEERIQTPDGFQIFLSTKAPFRDSAGRVVGLVGVARDITDRKRAQDALRDSETRYRLLFRNMLDGFAYCRMIYDERGRPADFVYLEVNDAFGALTGLGDVVGKKATEVFPGIRESYSELLETYGRVARTGHPERFEIRFEPLGISLKISVYRPEPDHFVAVFDDVTERKRAEQERETTVEFLRLVNGAGTTDELVKAAAAFFQRRSGCEAVGIRLKQGDDYPYWEARGFSSEFVLLEKDLCRRDAMGNVVRDDAGDPALECMCGAVISGRIDPTKPFFTPRGSFWANETTQLLATTTNDDRGARTRNRCNGEGYESVTLVPLAVGEERLGLLQLNDRRKGLFSPEIIALWERLAGYLAVALARLRSVERYIEAQQSLSVVTRLYAVLSRVNEVIVRTRDEVLLFEEVCRIVAEEGGFPLVWVGLVKEREVVPAASSGRATGYLRDVRMEVEGELGRGPTGTCVREGRPVINDDFRTNPSTSPWREASLKHGLRASASFPLRRGGEVIGVLSFYAERPGAFTAEQVKLIEALCADISYALEAMRHERLRGEAERALRESERSLREADRRKDEFLGMLSHELRNPLAPIRNSVYILKRTDPAGEQAERARNVIERQSEHLTRLVDDLLDVTRIVRGKIELRLSLLDLKETVRRAADDFRATMEERGLEFRTVLPLATVLAHADATRVTQVIGNLLHNAAKFTRRGDAVTLSLDLVDGAAEIRVRDTGEGIEPAVLPHVFDAFVQGQRTLARSEGGLGLGLALVKGITELHGGSVRVESGGRGQGAEFVVRLPLAARATPQERVRPVGRARDGVRRVLVVDDNRDAADSMAEIVELIGHQAEVAYDGRSAVEKAAASAVDVVLCDIGLPGMSGYEVAKALRQLGREGLLLVAVTGYAQPEDVKKAIESGFDRHLAKPVRAEDFERLLGKAEQT